VHFRIGSECNFYLLCSLRKMAPARILEMGCVERSVGVSDIVAGVTEEIMLVSFALRLR
jgi:hypothetical protein